MKIKVLIKTAMLNYKVNEVVVLDADKNGIPTGLLGKFFRRRLKDSETDNCCEVVEPAPVKAKKGSK